GVRETCLRFGGALDDDGCLASPRPARLKETRELFESAPRGLFVNLRHLPGDAPPAAPENLGRVLERLRQPLRRLEPDKGLRPRLQTLEKSAPLSAPRRKKAHEEMRNRGDSGYRERGGGRRGPGDDLDREASVGRGGHELLSRIREERHTG